MAKASPPDDRFLYDLLSAASASTSRSRATVFILTGASIIAFAAAWKAMPFSWQRARVRSATAALDYLTQKQCPTAFKDLDKRIQGRLATIGVIDEVSWCNHLKVGQQLAEARGFFDDKHARAYLNVLEKNSIETVASVHLPIFGVTFDVNDLGMFGGIGFAVLLVTLRLTLNREVQNLRAVFDVANRGGRPEEAYQYLSMSQVMTVPAALGSRLQPKPFFWVRAPMLLIWLPCLVQSTIFINDFATMPLGQISSPPLTLVTLLMSFASVIVILILTSMCWHQSGTIDHEWSEMCRSISDKHARDSV